MLRCYPKVVWKKREVPSQDGMVHSAASVLQRLLPSCIAAANHKKSHLLGSLSNLTIGGAILLLNTPFSLSCHLFAPCKHRSLYTTSPTCASFPLVAVENRSCPTFVIDLRVTRARTSQVHGGTLGSESPLRRIDHRLPFPTKFPPGLFHTSHKCCSPRPDRRLKPGSYRPQSALDHDQLKLRVPWCPERERRRLSLPPRATMTASPNSLDPSSPDPPASYPHE